MSSERKYLYMTQNNITTPINPNSELDKYLHDEYSPDISDNVFIENQTILPATWAEINLTAVEDNTRTIQHYVGEDIGIMAIIKSDAYGHGLLPIAERVLKGGAKKLGVNDALEVKLLRDAGITIPIVCLYPPITAHLPILVRQEAEIVVKDSDTIKQIATLGKHFGVIPKVQLEIETGMHRYGIDPSEALQIITTIQSIDNIAIEGIFTHFAHSRDIDLTTKQMDIFIEVLKTLASHNIHPPTLHIANSAAIAKHSETWNPTTYSAIMPNTKIFIRPGTLMYGYHNRTIYKHIGVQPTLTVIVSHVTQSRNVSKGEGIGYGHTETTTEDTSVATIPVGWGNCGYLLHKGKVLAREGRNNSIGLISNGAMQFENTTGAQEQERVQLLGKTAENEITIEELAEENGLILQQLISMITARMPRVYYEEV